MYTVCIQQVYMHRIYSPNSNATVHGGLQNPIRKKKMPRPVRAIWSVPDSLVRWHPESEVTDVDLISARASFLDPRITCALTSPRIFGQVAQRRSLQLRGNMRTLPRAKPSSSSIGDVHAAARRRDSDKSGGK
jgi:hypothetical protein